jgi:hypothetical protein
LKPIAKQRIEFYGGGDQARPIEGTKMASIRKETTTSASADEVWAALRDLDALHTRLVPGFVIDTRLEPGARVVTFGNGMVVRETIVTGR